MFLIHSTHWSWKAVVESLDAGEKNFQWCQKRFLLRHSLLRSTYPQSRKRICCSYFLGSSVSICCVFHAYLQSCGIRGPLNYFVPDCFSKLSADTVYNPSPVVSFTGKKYTICLHIEIFVFWKNTSPTKIVRWSISIRDSVSSTLSRVLAKIMSDI